MCRLLRITVRDRGVSIDRGETGKLIESDSFDAHCRGRGESYYVKGFSLGIQFFSVGHSFYFVKQ